MLKIVDIIKTDQPLGDTPDDYATQINQRQADYEARQKRSRIKRGDLGYDRKDYAGNVQRSRYGSEISRLVNLRNAAINQQIADQKAKEQLAITEKPQATESSTYESYSKDLADWMNKYPDVLQTSEAVNALAKTGMEELKGVETRQWEGAISAKPNPLGKKEDVYQNELNQWITKYQGSLSLPDVYETSNKILSGGLSIQDIKPTEQAAAQKILTDINKFGTYKDAGGRLLSTAPQYYAAEYVSGGGHVMKPYFEGTYEELDPNSMTVNVKNSQLLGWKTQKMSYWKEGKQNKYSVNVPQIKETIVSSYKLGDVSPLAKQFVYQEKAPVLSYKTGTFDYAKSMEQIYGQKYQDQQKYEKMLAKQQEFQSKTPVVTWTNPYTGKSTNNYGQSFQGIPTKEKVQVRFGKGVSNAMTLPSGAIARFDYNIPNYGEVLTPYGRSVATPEELTKNQYMENLMQADVMYGGNPFALGQAKSPIIQQESARRTQQKMAPMNSFYNYTPEQRLGLVTTLQGKYGASGAFNAVMGKDIMGSATFTDAADKIKNMLK